jgi:hypothetical protein
MNNPLQHVCGVHLVDSVPYDNSIDVFTKVLATLGNHLKRLPDGETGVRTNWVDWQLPMLAENPNLELVTNEAYEYTQMRQVGLKAGCDLENLELGDIGYASAALASYADYQRLKTSRGEIPSVLSFQACLPTPLATTHVYVEPTLQVVFESLYEDKLLGDLDFILAKIPHSDLAVQWDTAVEFALLEGVMPSYIEDLHEGIMARLLRLASLPAERHKSDHNVYDAH